MSVVQSMFRSHPHQPEHPDIVSRCVDSCSQCVEICTACADACLAEDGVNHLLNCIRLNLDCAAVCQATVSVVTRSNKAGNRQPLEALLTTCIAFCRACARECSRHAQAHAHCKVCADACEECATLCTDMLSSLRMPA